MDLSIVYEEAFYELGDPVRGIIDVRHNVTKDKTEEEEKEMSNIVIVVDLSGSMDGNPLQSIKLCIEYLVHAFIDKATLSIVGFNDVATVVHPRVQLTTENATNCLQNAFSMDAHGCTNMEAGLRTGAETLISAGKEHSRNYMICITDGIPNVGEYNPKILGNITSSVLGTINSAVHIIGLGYSVDKPMLANLADYCPRGRFDHVCSTENMVERMGAIIGQILHVACHEVQVSFPTDIIDNVSGLGASDRSPIMLGTFYAGERVAIPFIIKPCVTATTAIFRVSLDYANRSRVPQTSVVIDSTPPSDKPGAKSESKIMIQIELIRAYVGKYLLDNCKDLNRESMMAQEIQRLLTLEPKNNTLTLLAFRLTNAFSSCSSIDNFDLIRQQSDDVLSPLMSPLVRSYSQGAVEHVRNKTTDDDESDQLPPCPPQLVRD